MGYCCAFEIKAKKHCQTASGHHARRHQMARHKPQANSRQLAFYWPTFVALSFGRNRNAAHPVNAVLNYADAALESEIRINAVSEGYDPMIGIMHEGSDGSAKFVFDLMEPERPRVDRAVLDLVKRHVFDPADFVIRTDGVCA